MSKESSFIIRTKYETALRSLPAEQQGEILMACIAYVARGERVRLKDRAAQMLLSVMIEEIEFDKEKYRERCEKNRKNVQKRYTNSTNVNDCIRSYTNATDTDTDSDTDSDADVYMRSPAYMDERKADMKRQISDLTKITLSRMGGAS